MTRDVDGEAGSPSVRFTSDPADAAGAGVVVVLDSAWTPPAGEPDAGPRRIGLRDLAGRVLAERTLAAETSELLDTWAATSGVVEALTIGQTSFWFYVRLRHWLWLQERILWAAIVDTVVGETTPRELGTAHDADEALLDVLRLVATRDGIPLRIDEAPGDATPDVVQPSGEPAPRTRPAADAAARPAPVATLRRLVRRARRAIAPADPPTAVRPAKDARREVLAGRTARVAETLRALEAGPHGRLLVVYEHARQVVETAAGPRSMNAYLDPVVDRLRGTPLEPFGIDIRAKASDDAAWQRLGSGNDPGLLPADALAVGDDHRIETADAVPDRPTPGLDAWRQRAPTPVPVSGLDLGPLLAADVAATASSWLPGMTRVVARIERFLRRLEPAAILIADEYHRQDWLEAARAVGVPVVALQHGIIHEHHAGYIHRARPASLRLPDRLYVYGSWERELLVGRSVYRPDEVVVGGSPRLDLARVDPGEDDRARLRAELGIAPGERLLVLSGTWGGLARRFHYPIALARLVDRPLPGVHLVVKLHPGERDEGPYRQVVEGVAAAAGFAPPRLTVVQAVDLYRLLAAADAHLGIQSTVLTEAVVARTPNLLADLFAGGDLLGYVAAGVAIPVRDGGELLAALERGRGALDADAARAFATSHFEPGDASARIAAELLAWLSG